MKTVIMGLSIKGSTVSLLDQNNGYLEVRVEQRGTPARVVGMFEKRTQFLEALNRYHQAADAMKLIGGGRVA